MKQSNRSLVDAYIEALPDQQQEVMQYLRTLIWRTVPQVEERFSFKIPFYHYFGMFCYLSKDGNGVSLSFCRGKDLVDAFPQLQQKSRAIIASVTLYTTMDIMRLEIPQLIAAAAQWNEEAKKLGVAMVKKAGKPAKAK
jgi:hypothetical protein